VTIRWALVGPGRHAERSVVQSLKSADGAELAAVVSRDPARGAAFAAKHAIARVHASFEALLRDREIDAIYDATPDALHAPHAIEAAKAGKHVLVEKPLAISVASGAEAIAAAERHGVQLGVVFNQRHEPAHQEARRLVAEGAIGEVVLAYVQIPLRGASTGAARTTTWRADPAMRPGGIGWSIGDHAFDTLSYLVGREIEEVAAFTDATRTDPPDERSAALLLRLSGGALGHAAASARTPFSRRPFEIHGTKGSIAIENSFAYLSGAGDDPRSSLTLTGERGTGIRHFEPSDCFRLEIEQFNRAIEGKGRPMTPGQEGLRAVATGEAIFESVRSGRVARVAQFLPPATKHRV
jgi:1,5-anhydro-D-fructose reductase (1,5-anhydro-D-mannitol-forming)